MSSANLRGLLHYARHQPRKLRGLARLAWTTKLRSARKLATEEHGALRPPLVTINVNHACNLRCVQCWEWGENGAFKGLDRETLARELSLADWEAFFDQLAAWQPYLYFFGGEPFLRKDMPALVRAASRRGMLTSVNSNMTLVTED